MGGYGRPLAFDDDDTDARLRELERTVQDLSSRPSVVVPPYVLEVQGGNLVARNANTNTVTVVATP